MKKTFALLGIAISALILTSCGHNMSLIGLGTGFRAGSGEYGVSYGEGLFGTFVTKDGVDFKAELDSTNGFSYDPSSNTYKGIRSIEYSLQPQITGYAVEFAKQNPDVAKLYYDALIKYYETKKDMPQTPLISDEKSKEATTSVSDVIKKAIDKAKSIIDGGGKDGDDDFDCDGNCEYGDLTGNRSIRYQLSIALKLLSYDGYSHKMEGTGEYYTTTLEHFVTQVTQYQAKGHKNTPLLVKYVTVKDKVIEKLMFIYVRKDGSTFDVECPSCIAMDDEDAD